MRALKFLLSLQKKIRKTSGTMERGLMYVNTWINQTLTKNTMVDSDATHNFVTEAEARRLSLRWEKDTKKSKVGNYVALPIVGLVKQTTIK